MNHRNESKRINWTKVIIKMKQNKEKTEAK